FVARNSLSKSCTDLEDGRGQRRLILSKSLGESQDDDKIFFKNIRSAIWRLVLKGRSPKWRCRSSTGTPTTNVTSNRKGLANGNRDGWLKQDGGNTREGEQEWALSLLLVHAR
ncbi:hypothetical protein J6590_106947, partial [Homalodisca vitripennis]